MIDSRAFDGLVAFLLIIGAVIGCVLGGIGFWFIPWLCHHLSVHWV